MHSLCLWKLHALKCGAMQYEGLRVLLFWRFMYLQLSYGYTERISLLIHRDAGKDACYKWESSGICGQACWATAVAP
jgi:hypothetical protein